jgi:2-iminobutanoate/2-iminopropanoate deaminase
MKIILLSIFIVLITSNCQSDVGVESIDGSKTPQALGPYSKGTRVPLGDKYIIFLSGQIGLSPTTNELVSDEVGAQTAQALENLKNLLEENDSSFENVTKTTIYLTNINDFNRVNEVYGTYFKQGHTLPARATFAVKDLPKVGAKVEIELVAFGKINNPSFLY